MRNKPGTFGHLPKCLRVKEEIKSAVLSGKFGMSGTPFMQIRALAAAYGVSLVSAQKIAVMLKEEGLISQAGKSYVISSNVAKNAKISKIALIVTMLDNPFFALLAKNLESAARERGFELLTASSNYNVQRERELIDMFIRDGVDAILACPADEKFSAANYENLYLPCLLIGRKLANLEMDSVLVQNFSAGQSVAEHMIKTGKRRFAYIGLENFAGDQRLHGFSSALNDAGFELSKKAVLRVRNDELDSLVPKFSEFLKSIKMPAGIFCFHDLIASRLMKAALLSGIKIPDELAICGFDDLPVAAELIPSLTSVAYPLDQMAQAAVSQICRRIEGNTGRPVTCFLDPVLIPRESTIHLGDSALRNLNLRNFSCNPA